jgi:DNA polymerase III alpha subunit
MKFDKYGQAFTTETELCDMLYQNPNLNLGNFYVEDPAQFNRACMDTYSELPLLEGYTPYDISVEEFDHQLQSHWRMPAEYLEFDIATHILSLCKTEPELQRVGEELLLYQERDLFNLLKYLKYFVDTMRTNNVVWGLGRGSSTASYVLYLLGVHKINSLYYDLPIEEFLK